MLTIKLKRVGKKHQGSFRIVVLEKRTKLNGRFTDDLGWVNPSTDKFEVDKKKVQHWLKVGAQPTPTVHNFLIKAGVLSGKKIAVHKQPKKPASAEASADTKVLAGKSVSKKEEGTAPAVAPAA